MTNHGVAFTFSPPVGRERGHWRGMTSAGYTVAAWQYGDLGYWTAAILDVRGIAIRRGSYEGESAEAVLDDLHSEYPEFTP